MNSFGHMRATHELEFFAELSLGFHLAADTTDPKHNIAFDDPLRSSRGGGLTI